jgi:hypothetical protein
LDDFDDMDRAIRKDQQVAFDGQFYTRTMWYRTFTRSFPHLRVAWCYPGGLLLRRQKARQVPRRSLPPKLYMICAPIHPMRQRNATKQQNVTKWQNATNSALQTWRLDRWISWDIGWYYDILWTSHVCIWQRTSCPFTIWVCGSPKPFLGSHQCGAYANWALKISRFESCRCAAQIV